MTLCSAARIKRQLEDRLSYLLANRAAHALLERGALEMTSSRFPLTGRSGTPSGDRSSRSGLLVGTAIVGLCVGLGTGCAFKAPSGRATPEMSALVVDRQPYRIRVGDTLDVRFYKTPELNVEKVPVRSDGKISLDLVGDVQAAGLEPDELSDRLLHDYGKELEEPRIAVIVRDFGGEVFVGGEVGKPAAVKYETGMTALQAINAVGGFNDKSSFDNVILMRRTSDRYEGYRLYLKHALSGDDYTQDVALQPNDVVFVPKSRIANVNLAVEQYISKNLPQIPISLPVF
jgi:polysaccharide export outer membrane protein